MLGKDAAPANKLNVCEDRFSKSRRNLEDLVHSAIMGTIQTGLYF